MEIFCGILADAKYGPNIREWKENERLAELVRLKGSVYWSMYIYLILILK